MRVLAGDTQPLEFIKDDEPFQVDVPGFGALLVGKVRSDAQIVRLAGDQWTALLVQRDATGRYSKDGGHHPRDVIVTDEGRLEVELLPNVSDEERLVVVIEP